ncbi:alcohol acetyltransferase [Acidipropionibacterium virtanenii]|uniref:Alcohol acetyltransferase n=1 Tax=Acidipropionibacterium virtanenii TaxID=2057246 RepID=A0A344UW38_9ACTN|nr:alcohol acetyltransferase [Acidipropionibacterium virtanenii]AXE39486.1 hypothetical protein JS278_02345 [Acidipropionibacterium virtanenii]
MTRRAWVALDNASNIFLAARSEIDPKVFRISAEMDDDVDPELLQRALDETYDDYPLYHAVLRRGIFWYYLQDSDLRPAVGPDAQYPCAPIYQADRRNLLFRVMHHRRRIILETFHALSDGTGALWFITDLLDAYCRLCHPGDPVPPVKNAHPVQGLSTDSFAHYFRGRGPVGPAPGGRTPRHPLGRHVQRVRGTRTPDDRTRLVELTMPAADVLALARAEGVGLTVHLTALFLESVRRATPATRRAPVMTASIPVNLRQYFPSASARNFFAAIRVEHDYRAADNSVAAVARDLESQFRPRVTPEALHHKLHKLIRFERMPLLRIVPSTLKNDILKGINQGNNRALTVAVSNLGRVALPQPAESHVGRMLFHTAAVRPQFCAVSHAGQLTVSFTSPFVQVGHVREFARLLTAAGIDVTVAMERVTEAEISGAPS